MQRQRGELIPVGKSSAACPVQAIRDRPRRCTTSRRTIRREVVQRDDLSVRAGDGPHGIPLPHAQRVITGVTEVV